MKKYLSGMVAVTIAIAFSAFTNIRTGHKSDSLVQKYWYDYSPSTNELTAEIGFVERTDAMSAECPDNGGQYECARAFDYQVSGPFPVASPGDKVDYLLRQQP